MSLERGTSFGHYTIEEPIGKGGMGEVYRARDTRLGRDVAIKVLPEELSRDKERKERFEREARLLAQINHPNIATLHGLEEYEGQLFLVMELVEGETLAERIARGPIPIDEAIPLFIQIAEGLEAAHEKAIIHRDLKPANIKIGEDGKPKILDFGLAKAFSPEQDVSAATSQSPTLTKGTALGAILGTASYMSPEQARGKSVDKRTDIWAFGCCLYEALAGKKAFDGETVSDIIGSVLRDKPELHTLPPQTARLVELCLRKDPSDRLRDVGDARLGLREPALPSREKSRQFRVALPWALFAVAVTAAIWSAISENPQESRVTRFTVDLPENARFPGDGPEQHVAFSPDGLRIAFTGRYGGDRVDANLYVLERDRFTPERIPRTEGARNPFFSPDSQWVGFFARGKLWRVAVGGGAPITIGDATASPGASWGPDDRIIYAERFSAALLGVSGSGGTSEPVTALEPGETGHRWPQHLPDGEHLLFAIRTERGTRVVAKSLKSGKRKTVFDENMGTTQALYIPSGHILYDQSGSVLASAFDLDTLEPVGTPASVAKGAHTFHGAGGLTYVASSSNGDLVFMPASVTHTTASLGALSAGGSWSTITETKLRYQSLKLDPDGERIAVEILGDDGGPDIWLYDLVRSTLSPLSREGRSNSWPKWSPDGRSVTFGSGRAGRPPNLFSVPADGSENAKRLLESPVGSFPLVWTPDGQSLIYRKGADIWVLDLDGDAKPMITGVSPSDGADLSPDGRWLAYVSDESGQNEVYVTSYPATGARVPISTAGGDRPVWSPKGGNLYFRSATRLIRVSVKSGEGFSAGSPEVIAEAELIDYDITPDERIVAILPEGPRGWNRLHVVFNWIEELNQIVPTN